MNAPDAAFDVRPDPHRAGGGDAATPLPLSGAEFGLAVGMTSTIVVGCVALFLAYFGVLSHASLVLALTSLLMLALAALCVRHRPTVRRRSRSGSPAALPLSATWHDAGLLLILIVAGLLFTPPADYAPAFLDAGWYTNTAALIARTGSLEAQPSVLQGLPPDQRRLFIRTYHDLRRTIPSFPDRSDLGFFNQVFAVDLNTSDVVAPYHPPYLAALLGATRVLAGSRLAMYTPVVFGLLYVLAIYATGRSVFGGEVGLLAGLLAALSPAVVYYARTPFAEPLVGACIWTGAWALSRYASGRPLKSSAALLSLAGLALGTSLLVKLEACLVIVPVGLFWLVWKARGRATRRELVSFAAPFSALLGSALFLAATVTRPYTILNGHGVWNLLATALHSHAAWLALPAVSIAAVGLLAVLAYPHATASARATAAAQHHIPVTVRLRTVAAFASSSATVRELLGLTLLLATGVLLMTAWWSARSSVSAAWSSMVALVLFATPLGAALALVGLSRLLVVGLNRRSAFVVLLGLTVAVGTVLVPAVSTSVSQLYTVRPLVPVVLPLLFILAAYALLSGLLGLGGQRTGATAARRAATTAAVALLIFSYVDALRPFVRHGELAGSSAFVARLAQRFDATDVVLFESTDRGSHVGRFAAPLWAEHDVAALQLSTTHPPLRQLALAVQHWRAEGLRVYYVTQSSAPDLPDARWQLVAREEWAGRTVAATLAFPPETWMLPITFNIYGLE
jgi:4-amino-4-deoxy-L-arabinose transferase-like glycosyltransferase